VLDVKGMEGGRRGGGAFVRASADGKVFGMRDGVGGEPHTVRTIVFDGEASATTHEVWGVNGSVLTASPDGRRVYTSGAIYTSEMKRVHPKEPVRSFAKPHVPSLHGDYFMRLDYKEWDKLGGSLTFFLAGHERPLVTLSDVEGVSGEQISYGSNRDKLT